MPTSQDLPIRVDTSQIPREIRNNIAAATLKGYFAYIQNPENKKRLDERVAAKASATKERS